ncbi:hypothetical protein DDZ13_14650 [Coraliomargarita sinensis]|uniref:IS66 family insertion sequence element accessory protein TnpB n=1 Tax=Coraliomargarita sinensis TaxID=2174842 RepID=A0A317ZGQ1_9BACT|nr:hypothetical protein [Coraliomargarita sinensis]PXA02939.1 hypothetical protein DDZ13_14650 [Coraliomargarita sinensis]
MESLDTEVVEDMEKRDDRGRRLISKEQWAELLSAYDSSGLTQRNFCRREGLNFNSFFYQLSRRRKKALPKEAPTPKFRQLQLSSGHKNRDRLIILDNDFNLSDFLI